MNRIQIIIFSFTALFLASLFSDGDEKGFSSDYDLRFVCGLKIDIDDRSLNFNLIKTGKEKKLSSLVEIISTNINPEFEIYRDLSRKHINQKYLLSSITIEDNLQKPDKQQSLHSPRSPPLFA